MRADAETAAKTVLEPAVAKEVCDALCQILREGVDVHRTVAAQALGRIADPDTVETLIAALLDEDEDVRTDAAAALAEIGDPRAAAQLKENLIGDPVVDVKLSAIDALTRLGDTDIIPVMQRLLQGRDDEMAWDDTEFFSTGWDEWVDVQVKAMQSLAEFGVEEAVADTVNAIEDEMGQDLTELGFKALAKMGPAGMAALAAYLDDPSAQRRRRAVTVIAGLDVDGVDAAIAKALQDEDPQVRLAAGTGLAARDATDARLALLLFDPNPAVRAAAVPLCARHHAGRITRLLDDGATGVQAAVLDLLAAEPGLVSASDVSERMREIAQGAAPDAAAAAAKALAAVTPHTSFELLAELAGDANKPLEVRLGAVAGLATIEGDEATQSLTDLLADDERQLRLETMAALARLAAAEWPNPAGNSLLAALKGELLAQPEPEDEEDSEPRTVAEPEPEPEPEPEVAETEEDAEPSFPMSTLESVMGAPSEAMDAAMDGEEEIELGEQDLEFLGLTERNIGKKVISLDAEVAPHQDVRRFAARVLGDLDGPDVAAALAEALAGTDNEVRLAAADSLARIGERAGEFEAAVFEALVASAGEAEKCLRLSVTRALGRSNSDAALKPLARRLRDKDTFVRAEAIRGFARLNAVDEKIVKYLGDEEPAVRLAAAEALGASGNTDFAPLLVDYAFAFEGYSCREAARILRRLDANQGSRLFLAALADPERKRTWKVAIEALEELDAVAPLAGTSAIARDT